MTQSTMRLTVNGKSCDADAAPDTALLYVLRNDLALNGPKYGCGLGECGACAVLIDGEAARSCVIPIEGCAGREPPLSPPKGEPSASPASGSARPGARDTPGEPGLCGWAEHTTFRDRDGRKSHRAARGRVAPCRPPAWRDNSTTFTSILTFL